MNSEEKKMPENIAALQLSLNHWKQVRDDCEEKNLKAAARTAEKYVHMYALMVLGMSRSAAWDASQNMFGESV